MAQFYGEWIHADDPTGAIPTDPIYRGSRLHFGEDGSYSFTMGGEGTLGPMTGTWRRVRGEGDELTYVATYDKGGEADPETLRLRRDDSGQVVGLEVHDGVTPGAYYVRAD